MLVVATAQKVCAAAILETSWRQTWTSFLDVYMRTQEIEWTHYSPPPTAFVIFMLHHGSHNTGNCAPVPTLTRSRMPTI